MLFPLVRNRWVQWDLKLGGGGGRGGMEVGVQ